MAALRFDVPVAQPPDRVAARLSDAARQPRQMVDWFTDDPNVEATVVPASPGWRLHVVGSAFTATALVTVHARGSGSLLRVDGDLTGRGLFSLASPALRLAVPRVEAEARRSLQREFGSPDAAPR